MFSTVQQLCQLEHILSVANLKLTSVSSIKLSLPHELPFLLLPPPQRLTALVSAGTWVARGNGLRISVNICTEGISFIPSDREELVEALGVLLRDAEVIPPAYAQQPLQLLKNDFQIWKQLGLQAALTFPTERNADGEERLNIVLGLMHADPHGNTTSATKRRGEQRATYDPIPPGGILLAHIEEVVIKLTFSLIHSHGKLVRKRKATDTSIESDHSRLRDHLVGDEDRIDIMAEGVYSHDPRYCEIAPDRLMTACPTTADDLELDDDSMLDADSSSQESMVFSDCSQVAESSCSSAKSSPAVLENNATEHVENNGVMLGDCAKLIDSSFRRILCGERGPAAQGVRATKDSKGPKLADIAPALFRPDYLSSLAQRNGLISSIARSINAVHLRSKSPNLKLDIQRMTELSLDERILILRNSITSEGNDEPPSDLTPAIKLRLWQIAQRILLDPTLSRRLKSMQIDNKGPLAGGASSQVMLEDDVSLHYTARLPAEVEHQILLDDNPFDDSALSSKDNVRDDDWHTLFDDYAEFDDESDLLDMGASEDELLDSLLFGSLGSNLGDELHTGDLEASGLKESLDGCYYQGYYDLEAEETLFQDEGTALIVSFEEGDSMLEDYDERVLDPYRAPAV